MKTASQSIPVVNRGHIATQPRLVVRSRAHSRRVNRLMPNRQSDIPWATICQGVAVGGLIGTIGLYVVIPFVEQVMVLLS